MKKKFLLTAAALLLTVSFYGQKLATKTGTVKFEATVPSFEEVAAENKTTSAVVDAATGDIAVLALIKGFRFKVALMEEHFNENYVESDKYPKASFKGKVEGFDLAKISSEAKTLVISGELTLHGKTKHISGPAKISKKGDSLVIAGAFEVKPADFGIDIPSVVSKKIADKINVTYSFILNN